MSNADFIACTEALLQLVSFQDLVFTVREDHGGVFLQGHYVEPDALTGQPATQYTRKWLLSPEMTDSEIVFTAFKLCLTSMEHRTREFFTYRGARVMSPHFHIEDLVRLCQAGRADSGARAASA